MKVFVLFDQHGSGSVVNCITDEVAALKWECEDRNYRAVYEFTVAKMTPADAVRRAKNAMTGHPLTDFQMMETFAASLE